MTIKNLKSVSDEEMREKHPALMDALAAKPEDVDYCWFCDGLRLKAHTCRCCWCGATREKCKCGGVEQSETLAEIFSKK